MVRFDSPSIYKIKVRGHLLGSWSNRLSGMQVTRDQEEKEDEVFNLIGKVQDQAELSGILKTLYELRLTLLSLTILNEST